MSIQNKFLVDLIKSIASNVNTDFLDDEHSEGIETALYQLLKLKFSNSTLTATKSQLDTYISNNNLSSGSIYKTKVHPSLYVDGIITGTEVYLLALNQNKLSPVAIGKFYNPKYNTSVNDFGIWNNVNKSVCSVPVGTLRANEIITANNGATATLLTGFSFNKIFYTILTGDWSTVTSITGNTSGATANLSSPTLRTYAINSKVIWGGYVWINLTGNVGTSTNLFTLDSTNWQKIPYNEIDYNVSYDEIEYDYVNNLITKRKDLYNNTVQYELADLAYNTSRSVTGNPVNVFQWGCRFSQRNIVHSSFLNNLNTMGEVMGNELSQQSIMDNNFLYTDIPIVEQSNVLLYMNILKSKSEMRNNVIIESAIMHRNTLISGSVMNSNRIYNTTTVDNNILMGTSSMNSNEIRRATWTLNVLKNSSTISSNLSNQNTGHIRNNDLETGSSINSNILNGIYVQAVGSDRCFIYNNKLNFSQINSNTLNVGLNSRGSYINNCILLGDNSADTQIRLSGIYFSTITGTTATTYLRMITLRIAQILNLTITNSTNEHTNNEYQDIIVDYGNITSTLPLRNSIIKANSIEYYFTKTFNGSAGSGLIGSQDIPLLRIPGLDYYINQVSIDVKTALVSSTNVAKLNVGFTGNNNSAINDATGLISTLNTNSISQLIPASLVKTTVASFCTINSNTEDITSGTIGIIIKLNKI